MLIIHLGQDNLTRLKYAAFSGCRLRTARGDRTWHLLVCDWVR